MAMIIECCAGMATFAISMFLFTLVGWHIQDYIFSKIEKTFPYLSAIETNIKKYFNL